MPYALRAIKKAPVAVPLSWDEAKNHDLHPQKYTMHNIFRRMARKEDPWKNMQENAVSLKEISSML
jgi:bifunctional non-homologous end joining protein LigD